MLIEPDQIQGVFRGFEKGGMSFEAEIVVRYSEALNNRPIYGQFILVKLESVNEALLGRITGFTAEGSIRDQVSDSPEPIPTEDREHRLRYRVSMVALGVVREAEGKITFVASHRRLPHVGSPVVFPSTRILRALAQHDSAGVDLGFLAYGEYIYAGDDARLKRERWMQIMKEEVVPKFDVASLVARRTYVFARAGFGKSNLLKLLCSALYKEHPSITKRGGKRVPVGMLLCDPQGEYFWPDDKGRPGLCDVPELAQELVVFTDREDNAPSEFYRSFVAGGTKLDLRELSPGDVMSLVLPAGRQDNQNVIKIKSLSRKAWVGLIDIAYRDGMQADLAEFQYALGLKDTQEVEALAARANIVRAVRLLHDPGSMFLDWLFASLVAGKLCVVDISNLRGTAALALTGLLMKLIFNHNQDEFTRADSKSIPVVTVLEEAQSVLGRGASAGNEIYEEWVKQGRKYDLGCVLVTQQPGALPQELLSQGDTWFLFHLLAESDLHAASAANAHFSPDILSCLLHEPIPGQGVFWSSVSGAAYPLPVRILSFETCYAPLDLDGKRGAVATFATQLKDAPSRRPRRRSPRGSTTPTETGLAAPQVSSTSGAGEKSGAPGEAIGDTPLVHDAAPELQQIEDRVLIEITEDTALMNRIESHGIPWRGMIEEIEKRLPPGLRPTIKANVLVASILDRVLGKDRWRTEKRPGKSDPTKTTTWIVCQPDGS